jgi:hypothetical protein
VRVVKLGSKNWITHGSEEYQFIANNMITIEEYATGMAGMQAKKG